MLAFFARRAEQGKRVLWRISLALIVYVFVMKVPTSALGVAPYTGARVQIFWRVAAASTPGANESRAALATVCDLFCGPVLIAHVLPSLGHMTAGMCIFGSLDTVEHRLV